MALDFDLELNTDKSTGNVLNLILDLENFNKAEFDNGFYADGMIGGVSTQKNKDDYYSNIHQDILEENFGFRSTIKVWFRPDGHENYEIGMRNGLKAFMEVLKSDQSDAVVIMNGESVRLIRRNQKLVLDADSFHENENLIWSFKEVPFVDYEVRKLQNID